MNFFLLGKNIDHSLSPMIHKEIYNHININAKYDLKNNINDIYANDFIGCNVTIPFKKEVISKLYKQDEISIKLNSVNTIVNSNGKLYGYNTDYFGFNYLIKTNNISVKDKTIIILGNGSTANMIETYMKENNAKKILFVTRKKDLNLSYTDKLIGDILINATPIGINNDLILNKENIIEFELVIDLLYNPVNTKLLLVCKKNKIKCFNGLQMLVAQAVKSCEIWFNKKINIEKIYSSILSKTTNVVLIGPMNSGKTTIGKIVSEQLNKKFIDTDKMIVEDTNKTIKKLFDNNSFRENELKICENIKDYKGYIISTGGGVVLSEKCMDYLLKNSIVIYLKRNIEDMLQNIDINNRPLLNNKSDLVTISKERFKLYKKYSDILIENNNIKNTVNKIKNIFK